MSPHRHSHGPHHAPGPDGVVLELQSLGVELGDRRVLDDVSFSVRRGELIAVVGPNGAGKSTLMKAICGLVNHDGVVEVNGVHCHDRTDRMDIAYIPQRNESDLAFPLTVGELVCAGRRRFRRWWQRPTESDRVVVDEALTRVLLPGTADRSLTELSGGQLQRAYLARSLAQQASVVLLDEALSGVDEPTTEELFDVFAALVEQGTTLLVATHDLGLVRRRFPRCLAVNGTLLVDGAPSDVLSMEAVDTLFSVRPAR